MYCICVLGDISFIYYWRSHVLYMCVRGYQLYLLLEKSCTVYVCQGISVFFPIGEVMYCICVLGISVLFTIREVMYCTCVLGDISFIYHWRSHVLYICVMVYQFYLLLEKSCTVYVCQGISVLFTIGEVMYCICVLGDISFIYYWRSHVLYMCVRGYQFLFTIREVMYCICVLGDISFIYYWRSHVLYMCAKGYQFYLPLEKSCTIYVCQGISVLFTIGEVMYCICVLGDISFIYYWRSHVLYMCVRGYQFYLLLEKSCTVYVCQGISVYLLLEKSCTVYVCQGISVLFTIGEVMYCICVLRDIVVFTIGEVMYCICVLGDISFIYYWRSHVLYMCVRGYQFSFLLEKSCTVYVCQGISVLFTIGEVMYCICVLGDISFIYYWRSHVLYMCVRGYQFQLLLEKSCTVHVCQGISVFFPIGEVMYCICVLGDISFIYYWRSHVLYMCVRGYQFYLLLEKSCTVYVCQGISVFFPIGEVMYCIYVLWYISFIYYWRSHVLYMCVRDISFIYYQRSHVLYMCVRGYQFYLLLEKSCTVYVCQGISVLFTIGEVMYYICVLGDISFIYYWRSHVLYMCVRGYQFYLLLEKSCTVYVYYGISVLFTIGEVMYCTCVLEDISFIYYWRSHVLYMCVR